MTADTERLAMYSLLETAWDMGWEAAGKWQLAEPGALYPQNPYRAALAEDQPDAEVGDLPNGHAPVEELSPFLRRRIQPEPTPEPPHFDPVLVQLHRYMERYEDRRGATKGQRSVLDAIQDILDGGQVAWAPSDDRRDS